ncbi:hypothetical protein [Lactobacillus helveticus]|uniref:hypothetical protein n=1 Tax=Lactobacillus helveticus TaxID=1587 RepID=UPI00062AA20F|nr:hypothetical protein [Lactobacillus helveticus]AKG66660.1 hypothetical protein TU99_04920 [Lactobacillus helveticus]
MNTQTEISESAVADKPKSVKLELSEEEDDMIKLLLSDYVLAYRSDSTVDYKPELIAKEKVGQYPWIATPPAPEIVNPAYDWINNKWYSKNTSYTLPVLANMVDDLKDKNEQFDQEREKLDQDIKSVKASQLANAQQTLLLTQAIKALTESENGTEKLMSSMQEILVDIKATKDQKNATPIESPIKQTQPVQEKNENGGK